MKAVICTKYGSPDVLRLQEVRKPVPLEDEVLIKIHAASLNSRDLRMLRAIPFFIRLMPGGLFRPKNEILGADLAGQIEAIGRNVRQFLPGDEVFGFLPSATGRGAFAEYVCVRENLITLKPANLSFEQAAAVPSPVTAAATRTPTATAAVTWGNAFRPEEWQPIICRWATWKTYTIMIGPAAPW